MFNWAKYRKAKGAVKLHLNLDYPWLMSPRGEKTPLRPGIRATGRVIVDRNTVFMTFLRQLDFIHE